MRRGKYISLFRLGGLGIIASSLSGCKWAVMDPKGPIGADEKSIIITATLLMLIVVIPVIFMVIMFAWKYRASNKRSKSDYDPNWSHSTKIELVVWTVPCLIVIALAIMTWRSTHALDPYKKIQSATAPVNVEAVSLDWKWLFIYPDQHIATVNELAFPVGTPVNFKITSDTVMNAFFIPSLGTQIYSMAGMTTKLSLLADHVGTYAGISSNYSGAGFSDMKFKAIAMSPKNYRKWLAKAAKSPEKLDVKSYAALARPSEKHPVAYYSSVTPNLYDHILTKWQNHGAKHGMHMSMAGSTVGQE